MQRAVTMLFIFLVAVILTGCAGPVVYEGPTPTIEVSYENDKPCK